MKKIGLVAVLIFIGFSAFSQFNRDIFPLNRQYKKSGFYISPLATISFGNKETGQINLVDTTYKYEVIGRGKWGYGVEAGWYQTFDNLMFITFIEGGLSYRMFQGAAEYQGDWFVNETNVASIKSDNTFKIQTAVATIRAVNVKELENKSFFTFALGVNYNYIISSSYKRSAAYPSAAEKFLKSSSLQAHFQIGYGFKVSDKLLLIPTLETPLITGLPTDDINPAFPFFSAKYHPLIIGLRFMFLREDPENCNSPTLTPVPGQ